MIDEISGSVGLCSDNNTNNDTSLFLITFGYGSDEYSNETSSSFNFSTGHQQRFMSPIDDGSFGFVNAVPDPWVKWHKGASDNTLHDVNGYMYLVNVKENGSLLFNSTVSNLRIRECYEFSTYLANIWKKTNYDAINPNVIFEVRDAMNQEHLLAQSTTGDIPACHNMTWSKYGLSFVASNHSVILLMISNAGKECDGDDLAIDDIELRACSTVGSCRGPSETTPRIFQYQEDSTTITEPITTTDKSTSTSQSTPSDPPSTPYNLQSIPSDSQSTPPNSRSTLSNPPSTLSNPQSTPSNSRSTPSNSQSTPSNPTSISSNPQSCNDLIYIGMHCNVSNNLCDKLQPCKNNGTCFNSTFNSYNCLCPSGFSGIHCELDNRPCKPHTCLYRGNCTEISDTQFNCTCNDGWQGIHCESMTNYCDNVTCQNRGVCRPLLLGYKCECLGNNFYSGRHCEIQTRKIIILNIVSKSFAYIAIIAMTVVAMFVVIMDLLKYCFGIDPPHEERERLRRKKQMKKRKRPVVQRFIYVNALPEVSDIPISTIEETNV